jgi:cytochrome c-type biogenesis protein CcmE
MRRKTKLVVGLGVIVACLVYLVISGFEGASVYYFTVSELQAKEAMTAGKRVKVAGKVVDGSIEQDRGTMEVRFRAEEGGHVIPVLYKGIVPDTFKDGAEVVVEGKRGSDGVFKAEMLLAKCPSKYEGMDLEEMKKLRKEIEC